MYVNVKMIPVETVSGIGGVGIGKAVEGENSSMMYLIHCKNLCKCYNVPTPSTTIKKIIDNLHYQCQKESVSDSL
jgi:hypothetical protein